MALMKVVLPYLVRVGQGTEESVEFIYFFQNAAIG
jgi:hypothetical protein